MPDIEGDIAGLPIWDGTPTLEPLSGGISNLSFTAKDRSGKYVVRITRDFPFHHVFRDREVMFARAAHAAGFAPEVVHSAPGLMVSRFIESRVLTVEDVRASIPRIAEFLIRFHREMAAGLSGPGFMFWVFHVNRDYVRQLRSGGAASEVQLTHWLAINDELEAAQSPLPIVVGHHDLLPGNWLDDGKRLWLIDFEYAGFDTAMFDLANLSSNSNFAVDQSAELLRAYFGHAPSESELRSHAAMEAASLLREALWSLVSVPHLDRPGVDYTAYAEENLAKLDDALAAYHARFGAGR
jgi:thiamine kinase-like enzyme